ncbi:unnamed protein product [Aphanomyces euteiches]
MGEGTYQGVLLSQDVLQCICSFQYGMDGAVKSLYEASKPHLERLNDELHSFRRQIMTYDRYKRERFNVMFKLYDLFVESSFTPKKAAQLLPYAQLFKPMVELMAMAACDGTLLTSLYIQRQLSGHTGEMLVFALSKWPSNKQAKCHQLVMLRVHVCSDRLDSKHAMECLANLGNLQGIHVLYEMSPVKSRAVDIAAAHGHLDIVQFFLTDTKDCETTDAMDQAATNGHLDVVQYLHENSTVGATKHAMDGAAANGHLEIVRFLHEHRHEGCSTDAVDFAATNGHFEIVKFLIAHRMEGYTIKAMDGAASQGHLDMLHFFHTRHTPTLSSSSWTAGIKRSVRKFLHRPSIQAWCTKKAMDGAAGNGHLDVVRFLHEHRQEGCSGDALVNAAKHGHLDVVHFLVDHRRECVEKIEESLAQAAQEGQLQVVKFLLKWSVKCGTIVLIAPLSRACRQGHVEIVRAHWHHGKAAGGTQFWPSYLVLAAQLGHLEIVRFFIEQGHIQQAQEAIRMAARNGHLETAKFLVDHVKVEQVQKLADAAALNGHLEIVKFFIEQGFEIDFKPNVVSAAKGGHLDILKFCGCKASNEAIETFTRARRALFHRTERS